MLAIIGFFAFFIAGILQLIGTHANIEMWLIILGGLLVCAHCIASVYGRSWYSRGTRV